MLANLKTLAQTASLLLGLLLVGNVLFHFFLYALDGKALADVMWQVHAVTATVGVLLLFLGRKIFRPGFY